MNRICPLCKSPKVYHFFTGSRRSHFRDFCRCPRCQLVFVPQRFWLPRRAEHDRYLEHDNVPLSQGYRSFLGRFADTLTPYLDIGDTGLDYGCGPCPVLASILQEFGLAMSLYDVFFRPDIGTLAQVYDFITCTETIEHFRYPRREFIRFSRILKPGGWLGIMTGILQDITRFPSWHYHADDTHVCFYTPHTMRWIADRFGWSTHFPADDIVLFRT